MRAIWAKKSWVICRLKAASSPAQSHQFRSPAWYRLCEPSDTRKATPLSVLVRVSTVRPATASVSPPFTK